MPKGISLTEADEKFIKICKEEFKYDIIVKRLEHTLWIYNPIKENIIDVKGSKGGPKSSDEAKESLSLRYIDTKYTGQDFEIKYDIGKTKTYSKDYGYSSTYTEDYQKRQSNILSAVQRSYLDIEESQGKNPLQFFALVIADTVKGIEIESITYLQDLKRAMSIATDMTQDEYSKRYLTELRGDTDIVGDSEGKHLEYRDITMGEFLARQITNRVNFKYFHSSFPPSDDTKKEIGTIALETMKAYQFDEYGSISFRDLNTDSSETVSKEDLNEKYPAPSQGKLIEIKFF